MKQKGGQQSDSVKSLVADGDNKETRFSASAKRILDVDDYFMKALRRSALRPDARLLFFVVVKKSVSIKAAMLDSSLSYRAFYTMLDRLKDHRLIGVESDNEDRRVRRLVPGAQFDVGMAQLPHF